MQKKENILINIKYFIIQLNLKFNYQEKINY